MSVVDDADDVEDSTSRIELSSQVNAGSSCCINCDLGAVADREKVATG